MSADSKASDSALELESSRKSLTFLHQARDVRALQPAAVERIARRLKGQSHRSQRAALWPALATLGLVLVAGAAYAVAKGGFRSLPVVGSLFAPASPTKESRPARHQPPATPRPTLDPPPTTLPSAIVSPVMPAVQPGPESNPTPVIERRRSPIAEPAKVPGPAAPSVRLPGRSPRNLALHNPGGLRQEGATNKPRQSTVSTSDGDNNPIVAESRSFASVIGPWHRTRNANATLTLLDAHERRYPNGHMLSESRVLRAEIYLAQGRESAALAVLDSLSLSGIPRARELRTVRGELRVKAGRCTEGKRDLGEVLEKSVADALAKRAAQAISHCP